MNETMIVGDFNDKSLCNGVLRGDDTDVTWKGKNFMRNFEDFF